MLSAHLRCATPFKREKDLQLLEVEKPAAEKLLVLGDAERWGYRTRNARKTRMDGGGEGGLSAFLRRTQDGSTQMFDANEHWYKRPRIYRIYTNS